MAHLSLDRNYNNFSGRGFTLMDVIASDADSGYEKIENIEAAKKILSSISMTAEEKELFTLYLSGQDYIEISCTVNKSEDHVGKVLDALHERLRKEAEKHY